MRKLFLISVISAALMMPVMAQSAVWQIHAINSLHPTDPIVYNDDFASVDECVDFLKSDEMKDSIEELIADEKAEHAGHDFFLDFKCVERKEKLDKTGTGPV